FWPVEAHDRMRAMASTAPADFSQRRIQRASGAVLSHRDWVDTDQRRARLRKRWQTLFQEFDVVICPTMPTVPTWATEPALRLPALWSGSLAGFRHRKIIGRDVRFGPWSWERFSMVEEPRPAAGSRTGGDGTTDRRSAPGAVLHDVAHQVV